MEDEAQLFRALLCDFVIPAGNKTLITGLNESPLIIVWLNHSRIPCYLLIVLFYTQFITSVK